MIGRNPKPALQASTAVTPAGATHLPGGAVGYIAPVPFPLASRVKTPTLLGGGGALGVVSFLKAPLREQGWLLDFAEMCVVGVGGDSVSPVVAVPSLVRDHDGWVLSMLL